MVRWQMAAIRTGLNREIDWPAEANRQYAELRGLLLVAGVAQRNCVTGRDTDCLNAALHSLQKLGCGTDTAQLDGNPVAVGLRCMVDVLHGYQELDAYLRRRSALVDFDTINGVGQGIVGNKQ